MSVVFDVGEDEVSDGRKSLVAMIYIFVRYGSVSQPVFLFFSLPGTFFRRFEYLARSAVLHSRLVKIMIANFM